MPNEDPETITPPRERCEELIASIVNFDDSHAIAVYARRLSELFDEDSATLAGYRTLPGEDGAFQKMILVMRRPQNNAADYCPLKEIRPADAQTISECLDRISPGWQTT